jgi:hypothetical protein
MSSIHSINARGGMGLVADRAYFNMSPTQFGAWVRDHHTVLVRELAKKGVSYDALRPALVPSTGDRQEMALLFNVDLMDTGFYGEAVAGQLLPLLGKHSTLSVLSGDIGLLPATTREMAFYSGLVKGNVEDWGRQYIYCVYLNNLSAAQLDRIHEAFLVNPSYLGYVPTTYGSYFRTAASTMLPTAFIKHREIVLLDHGLDDPWVGHENDIGFPFAENGLNVVSVNSQLHSPLLSYKIQSEVLPMYQKDIMVSLNAISDEPVSLSKFEVIFPDGKYKYLHGDSKLGLLRLAELDEHSPKMLAAVIQAELSNDYIYRLQTNPNDGTVQFNVVLELRREDGSPSKVAVALKYLPDTATLSFVTMK